MKKKKIQSKSNLKFENELRKIKLTLEKGAHIQSYSNIQPEIESKFLDYMEKFEKAYENSKQITVYELIGKPKFNHFNDISTPKIKKELNKLTTKMERKGLIVESVCEVDDKEMYRFITEELFQHKTDNIHVKGMMCHFIYEEFHPNHEYDIKKHTQYFVESILDKRKNVDEIYLANKVKASSGKYITRIKAIEKINLIRSFYSKFELRNFNVLGLQINDKKTSAKIIFDIDCVATIDGGSEKQTLCGTCNAVLKQEYNFWVISYLEMPCFKI